MKRIIISLFVFLPSHLMAANIDPSLKFLTIETEHFAIHYHQGLEEISNKAVSMVEDIHTNLSKDFLWTPKGKTHIVLIDDSDFANAFASVLPYNAIYIYVVPPMADMTIGEYEDWLKLAITHEYAHILTMDSVRGYSRVMRKIFGKPLPGYNPISFLVFILAAPPNVLLPSWWLEGIATWAETEHTNLGRGRSTFFEMILRMAVFEDNIPTIDQLNGEVPYWPNGHIPYIFGLRLKMYIAKKYGKESLGKLNIFHGGRFAYFINGVPKRLFRKNYVSLYKEMISDLKKEQTEKIEFLKKVPLTPFKTYNARGEILTNPRYSPDSSLLAFNKRDPHEHEAIIIVDKKRRKKVKIIRRLPSDHNITWSSEGDKICFTQGELYKGFNLYQDIYCYDIKNKKQKRLTKGLRAKDPDLSPDGKIFAFVKTERGAQNLSLLKAEGGEQTVWTITDYKEARVSSPRWSSDGKLIVFSVKDNKGLSSLRIYDFNNKTIKRPRGRSQIELPLWRTNEKTSPKNKFLQSNSVKRPRGRSQIELPLWRTNEKTSSKNKFLQSNSVKIILEDKFNNIYPVWSPDNKYILFTSDRTGVYNIFAYSVSKKIIYQITHVLGGALQPDISRDGKTIAFSSYNSRGFKIAAINYNPEAWKETFSPGIKPYWQSSQGKFSERTKSIQVTEPKTYSSLSTMIPRFWLPSLSEDHKGAVTGVFTAAQDVLAYNTYLAYISYGIESNNAYLDLSYFYDRLYPTFSLNGYIKPILYSDFFDKGDYYEKQNGLAFSVSVPINHLESRYKFTLGYELKELEPLTKLANGKFDGIDVFSGRRDFVFLGIEFSNALRYPFSISREEGRSISLNYRNYSKALGSDINSTEYIGSYQEHIGLSFLGEIMKHNVAYLNLKGGISEGSRIPQQAFQLGGNSIVDSEFPLRGYPSRLTVGKYITTAALEYRSPIRYLFKGWNTKPFFFDRLHGALFVDAGNVWNDDKDFAWRDVKVGLGGEIKLDMVLGYKQNITPVIGLAHGLAEEGETKVYFTINTEF